MLRTAAKQKSKKIRHQNYNLQKYQWLPNIPWGYLALTLSQGRILVSDLYWPHRLLQIPQPLQSCRFGIATWYLGCCLCICATSQYFTLWLPFAWSRMCNSSAAPAEQIPRDWCWTCSCGDKLGATPLLVVTLKHTSPDSGSSYLLQGLVSQWMAGRLM